MLDWFKKAEGGDPQVEGEDDTDAENDKIQGSETGFSVSPFVQRRQQSPMVGAEKEAFEWVMAKMEKEYPELSYADQIEQATDEGYFECGKYGLKVCKELPQ